MVQQTVMRPGRLYVNIEYFTLIFSLAGSAFPSLPSPAVPSVSVVRQFGGNASLACAAAQTVPPEAVNRVQWFKRRKGGNDLLLATFDAVEETEEKEAEGDTAVLSRVRMAEAFHLAVSRLRSSDAGSYFCLVNGQERPTAKVELAVEGVWKHI